MLLLKYLINLLEFSLFYIINRESVIPKIALIWQENQRYKRYFNEKNIKLPFSLQEKWFIHSMFIINPKARKYFTLVTPETILYRWKSAIKDYWTYDKPKTRKKGRPPITKAMKLLIVSFQNNGEHSASSFCKVIYVFPSITPYFNLHLNMLSASRLRRGFVHFN